VSFSTTGVSFSTVGGNMSISFTIESNIPELRNRMEKLVQRQLPFATTMATTRTAVKLRDVEVTREYRDTFETRNKGFIKLTHRVFGSDVKSTKATGIAVASIQPVDDPVPRGASQRAVQGAQNATLRAAQRHLKERCLPCLFPVLASPGVSLAQRRVRSTRHSSLRIYFPNQSTSKAPAGRLARALLVSVLEASGTQALRFCIHMSQACRSKSVMILYHQHAGRWAHTFLLSLSTA